MRLETGFTLVELLIVVAIIGVVAATAINTISHWHSVSWNWPDFLALFIAGAFIAAPIVARIRKKYKKRH